MKRLTQSSTNATEGVGLLQTADGALSQVTSLLNRAVTLSTEVANGTLNSSQVSSANQEYQNILTEIGNIGSTTNYNSNAVFSNTATNIFVSDGTSSGSTTFKEVVGSLSTSSVGTTAATGTTTALSNPTPTASTTSTGSTATFALSSATDTISGTLKVAVGSGTAVSVTLASGTSLSAAVTQLNADSSFSGAGLTASVGTGTNANKLIITGPADTGTAGTNTLALTGTSVSDTAPASSTSSSGPGVDFTAAGVSTLSAATASTVLTSLTTAIQDVAYQRGTIGASINQLNAAGNVASSETVNLTSAESSVRSTNFGQATSDMAKYKVLSQTGIAALAQANGTQQDILKLLQ